MFPQSYTSRNNYTGNWEAPESWDPLWTAPSNSIDGINITINGFITANNSIDISGTACSLIINDTLEVNGDLSLGNNVTLSIQDNGILIVRGNLTISNKSVIESNAYLVVLGNVSNVSTSYKGSFTSNDNPVKVFISGTVSTEGLTDYTYYPVFNCGEPVTVPYPNSACSYGNVLDLMQDPIYSFFQENCAPTHAGSNSPVCSGDTIKLTALGGTNYTWTGPGGFTSNLQNPLVSGAGMGTAGEYIVSVTLAGCTDTDTIRVIVNAVPVIIAGPDQELNNTGQTQMNASLTGSETGTWSLISGSGTIYDITSPTTGITELPEGENIFLWTVQNGTCAASAVVKLTVYNLFIPSVITPNGDGKNDFFKITGGSDGVELLIFNRWGNMEYRNDNYLNDWDGRNINGAELPGDTYFYIMKLNDGEIKKGSVLIKR